MKLKIDEEADALYLRLDESAIVDSKRCSQGLSWTSTQKNR